MNDIDSKRCFICGKCGSDSVDHIPPKCLFHKRYWNNNLFTVPSHIDCNKAFSKDDQYFRDNIITTATSNSKAAKELFNDKVVRSLSRKKAIGYRKKIFEETISVEVQTKDGIYIKSLPVKLMDDNRINSVLERTCRGIYYKTNSIILPIECPVSVHMLKPNAIMIREKNINKSIFKTIIPEIFEYILLSDKNDTKNSLFILFFYKTIVFYVNTGSSVKKRNITNLKSVNYSEYNRLRFTDNNLWIPPGSNLI